MLIQELIEKTISLVDEIHKKFAEIIDCNYTGEANWFNSRTYEITTPIIKSTMIYFYTTGDIDFRSDEITISTGVMCFGEKIDKKSYTISFKDMNETEAASIYYSKLNLITYDLTRFGDNK